MEKVLLTAGANRGGERLGRLLREAGFFVLREPVAEQALAQLTARPALWLLDAGVATAMPADFLPAAEARCREQEVFCLLYSDGRPSSVQMKALAPWAAPLSLDPGDDGEPLARIRDQLSIRRLAYERNQAQSQLLETQQQYRANLESAAQIQKSLLPRSFPEVPELRFAARFIPCAKAGGDLYNVLQLSEDTVMAYLFDVSGHGISAAMITVSVYQSLSLHTGQIIKQRSAHPPYYRIPSPDEVFTSLDREFPFERFEQFFTISYLLFNTRSGILQYSSAGHPPPLLVRADGSVETLTAGGGLIGVEQSSRGSDEGKVQLNAGDRIFLYSDGITEHMNGDGEMFGMEKLTRRLFEQRRRPLENCCGKVVESLFDFSHTVAPRDDVTLLGIEYLG